MTGRNWIMIYGPKEDGSYVVEFRTADGEVLLVSIPRDETAVIRHFQARMPHGLFVPDDASATPRTRDTQLVTEARSRFEDPDKSLQHQAQDWGSLTVKDG
jgi:hypothetical protein